jgi:light-regulated signal transduction histidine kinase (bacteriophytochrome)
MQDAAARMQALINDLLTFSRVTTRAQPFVAVDLNTLVQQVISDLEVRIQQNEAKLEVGPLPTIEADPLQMRQLFQNLLANALKFQQPGVPPTVRVYAQDAGEADVQLCVEDNGIGFDEKYLDRIFTIFQRLHGRVDYEGTGVGLAVCRKIVERHGGTITARSAPGEGATFIVTLPRSQPEPLEVTAHLPEHELEEVA